MGVGKIKKNLHFNHIKLIKCRQACVKTHKNLLNLTK